MANTVVGEAHDDRGVGQRRARSVERRIEWPAAHSNFLPPSSIMDKSAYESFAFRSSCRKAGHLRPKAVHDPG